MTPTSAYYERVGGVLLATALAACTVEAPNPTLPATSQQASPETATAPAPYTIATTAADVIGTWQLAKGLVIRFYEEGTYHMGFSAAAIDDGAPIANTFDFDGSQIRVTELSNSTGLSCGTDVGVYEVRLLADGRIQIVPIQDSCASRRLDTPGVYDPAP